MMEEEVDSKAHLASHVAMMEELLRASGGQRIGGQVGKKGNSKGKSESAANIVRYKQKYMKMRRDIKQLVFENASLCDQVAQTQEKLLLAKEERRFLLKKLLSYQAAADPDGPHPMPALPSSRETPPAKKPAAKRRNAETGSETRAPRARRAAGKAKRQVQPIALDSTGRPVFPIVLGGLTIHSLGEVVSDRPAYNTQDLIFPAGFCSTRLYASLSDPEQQCMYTCTVMDAGDAPRFEIAADGEPSLPIRGTTPSQCHAELLERMNRVVGIEVVNIAGRGAEFFGLSHPTVQNLIQSCQGARKCSSYRWQKFEVCRTPGGATVDARENDASLSFEALQRNIAFSKSHLSYAVKEEVVELDVEDTGLRDLLSG